MDKKVFVIASAILAFFAGAIWVSEVPIVATLVAFLEVCAGFACGFFYKKLLDEQKMAEYEAKILALRSELTKTEDKKVKVTIRKPKATK